VKQPIGLFLVAGLAAFGFVLFAVFMALCPFFFGATLIATLGIAFAFLFGAGAGFALTGGTGASFIRRSCGGSLSKSQSGSTSKQSNRQKLSEFFHDRLLFPFRECGPKDQDLERILHSAKDPVVNDY
jgi:hypothetical protein